MKRFFIWVSAILAVILFFFFIIYMLISSVFDTDPLVSDNSFLQIGIGGVLSEYEAPDPLEEYIRGSALDLKQLRQVFTMSAVDERIDGILLRIGGLQTGFAKIQEVRQLIQQFRSSGKKVLAHMDLGLTRDYYLATACDSIFLMPGGTLLLNGLSAEVSFYKGFLAKIGIEADFEHVGKYKNAPDIYTRQTMSEAQEEVINNILDARFDHLISTIASTRTLDESSVKDYINNISEFNPQEAVEYGLIDGIRYVDDVQQTFAFNDGSPTAISAGEYSRLSPSAVGLDRGARIAVIFCSGTMMGGEDSQDPVMGQIMGANRVIRNIRTAADSDRVKAIILRINSPGGTSIAADKIWNAVIKAREKKPVVASISDLGASGGYYIAMGADSVIAQPLSLIGSIGVYIGKFSLENLYDKLDINPVTIRRGKNAGLFSLNKGFSESERQVVKNMIGDFYETFLNKAADGRNKSVDEIKQIAGGRVWNGEDGLNNGLIDVLGGLDDAVAAARMLADIKSENVQLIFYPRSKSFFEQLRSRLSRFGQLWQSPLTGIENLIEQIQTQPLALMPFHLIIR